MKFGKRLQSQLEETLSEWRDKYLSYKQLKKRLKLISAPECFTTAAFSSPLREEPVLSGKSVEEDAPGEACRRNQADQGESCVNAPGHANAAATESQDSSVNGAGTVTEDTARKSSSGSAGVDAQCLQSGLGATDMKNLTAEEVDFINLLNAELEKFNTFFIGKEEDYVIRLQELKERIENVKDKSGPNGSSPADSGLNEEMINIRKDIVNFHGEMVLLENYSSLNYTGLVKILKKHDKRTGALLRMPFIQNVLHQPFFTTELLSKLVRECEMNLQSLFPSSPGTCEVSANMSNEAPPVDATVEIRPDAAESKQDIAATQQTLTLPPVKDGSGEGKSFFQGEDVENIYRSTVAALKTIKDLRRGSSTYNVFSLPPFSRSENDSDPDDSKSTSPCCATISICPKNEENRT